MKTKESEELTVEQLSLIHAKLVRDLNQWERSPEGIKSARKAKLFNAKHDIPTHNWFDNLRPRV